MRKTPPSQPPSRQNILKMTELLKKFKPLVNEKNIITGFQYIMDDGRPPERDEMLMVMTGAIYDIQSFIQNWDKGMAKQAELISDAMMAHQAMEDIGIQVNSLAEGFEKVTARHKQALDVLDFISTLPEKELEVSGRKAITAAAAFVNPIKKKIEEMSNEQTTDGDTNNYSTESPKIIPIDQPNPGPDDSEAEPRS